LNTLSEEGIAKINTASRLVLRRKGDSAVEFYNAANRFYVFRFIVCRGGQVKDSR